ncbi:MAG: hypothetical protein H0T76_16290 [Nannocystis sp.]|nr:hypothetical protein [Nannocystis sp.]MBA3548041.1 hypothetical protein [Nannocystis sp.]
MPPRPRQPHRTPLLAAVLIAACHFESAGLGDDDAGPDAGDTAASSAQTSEGGPAGSSSGATAQADSDSDSGGVSGDGTGSTGGGPPPPPLGCGNGVIDPLEQCDGGEDCTPACTFHVCGDGYLGAGEQCDEAGANGDTQSCTSTCQTARCGDGLVGPGEPCDDGNAIKTDACVEGCVLASCGDGFLQMNVELCDLGAGNGVYGGACNTTCNGPGPSCGDGVWDPMHEACDGDGAPENADCEAGCKPKCEFAKVDCNNDLSDGCTSIYSDKNNCGSCGNKCPNGCLLGSCY